MRRTRVSTRPGKVSPIRATGSVGADAAPPGIGGLTRSSVGATSLVSIGGDGSSTSDGAPPSAAFRGAAGRRARHALPSPRDRN